MKHDLIKYMSDRYSRKDHDLDYVGPVITISREYGCPGKRVAEELATALSKSLFGKGKKRAWRWIDKEIIYEAAKELKIHPENLKYVLDYEKKGVIDDVLSAQTSKYYKSDRKIRKTISKVIRNLSIDGNVIIVGRGGIAITRDIPKSLHVNLEASINWRALRISESKKISIDDAMILARDVDKKRKEFREYFEGKNTDYTRFDISYNCMTISIDEIVEDIVNMIIVRKLY